MQKNDRPLFECHRGRILFNFGREFGRKVPPSQLLFQHSAKFRRWMMHVFVYVLVSGFTCDEAPNRSIEFSPATCVTLPPQSGECACASMKIAGRGRRAGPVSARFRSAVAGAFLRAG